MVGGLELDRVQSCQTPKMFFKKLNIIEDVKHVQFNSIPIESACYPCQIPHSIPVGQALRQAGGAPAAAEVPFWTDVLVGVHPAEKKTWDFGGCHVEKWMMGKYM